MASCFRLSVIRNVTCCGTLGRGKRFGLMRGSRSRLRGNGRGERQCKAQTSGESEAAPTSFWMGVSHALLAFYTSGVKPQKKEGRYRSAKALRHPKSKCPAPPKIAFPKIALLNRLSSIKRNWRDSPTFNGHRNSKGMPVSPVPVLTSVTGVYRPGRWCHPGLLRRAGAPAAQCPARSSAKPPTSGSLRGCLRAAC